jgi:hypothetical protein
MTTAAQAQLKIYPAGRNTWRCESGQNNYKISTSTPGKYHCTCPARTECRHIKQLKALQGIQAQVPESAPIEPERRRSDRRAPDRGMRAEVAQLRAEVSQVRQLGFVSDRTYVFIDSKFGGVWYTLSRDNQPQPIEAYSLNGYIRKIEFKASGEGAKASCKLLCHVEADRQYILRTGHDTHFAKGLLMALSVMSPEQLARPVRINPQASKSTILCNLHQDGGLIRARYTADTDWRAVAIRAMENVTDPALKRRGLSS